MMDLADLDLTPGAEAGAELDLLHPVKGEPLGIKMTVLGADAPSYRRNLRTLRDEVAKEPEKEPTDPDTAAILNTSRTCACALTGWSGVVFKGETVTFSRDAAVRLLTDRPWIADQVSFFRDRRVNFFKE